MLYSPLNVGSLLTQDLFCDKIDFFFFYLFNIKGKRTDLCVSMVPSPLTPNAILQHCITLTTVSL